MRTSINLTAAEAAAIFNAMTNEIEKLEEMRERLGEEDPLYDLLLSQIETRQVVRAKIEKCSFGTYR